jgi:hypothetical protein
MKEIAKEVRARVGDCFGLHEGDEHPVDTAVNSKDQNFRAPS